MSERLRQFAETYEETSDAVAACAEIDARINEQPPATGYYVYVLFGARDGSVFYIGKGQRKRVFAHVKEFASETATNARKNMRIRELIAAGDSVCHAFVEKTDSETIAYRMEKELIRRLRHLSICNYSNGSFSEADRQRDKAKNMLAKMVPKEVWMPYAILRFGKDSEFLGYYDLIKSTLTKIANAKDEDMILQREISCG